jgi:hypothetical protein
VADPQPRGSTDQPQQHLDPRLRAALAPYLERQPGRVSAAVAELLTDLRAAAAADGMDFDAALDASADHSSAPHGGHRG